MSVGLLLAWSLLVALQLGWLPFARFAWAFNLWSYLPAWAAWLLGAASLALCVPVVRSSAATAFAAAARRVPAGGRVEAGLCGAVALALWGVKESGNSGDSAVLVYAAHAGHEFVFPEVGATFLLHAIAQVALGFGVDGVPSMRALSCACGGAAVWLLLRVARDLAPGAPAALPALVLLSGGFVRVFAGRIEVYPVLIVAVLAYAWAALRALRGAGDPRLPALCLGLAIWLHAAAVLLLPSLLAIGVLRAGRRRGRDAWREAIVSLLLAGAPLVGFFAVHGLLAESASQQQVWTRVLEILGRRPESGGVRWWVRGWGGAPSIGTDVVWLSRAHLKYLVNAFSLLVPVCVPMLLVLLLRQLPALAADAQARWLAVAAVPLALYATALRPFWGPWDWDLFALSALVLTGVGLRALASLPLAPGLAAAAVGFQLCFAGIPFLWIGAGSPPEVGPFGFRDFDYDLRQPARPPPERLAPWL
jgi:hypothetical protein